LKPDDAKYGMYYLSACRFNYGEEESPALLLPWTPENDRWKVIAWNMTPDFVVKGSFDLTVVSNGLTD
jgi:hypothetical protein